MAPKKMPPSGPLTGIHHTMAQSEAARVEAAKRVQKSPYQLTPMEAAARRQAAAELTQILPPELQHEQPTIIMGRFDEVTALTEQLNLQAKRLGGKYGIHSEEIPLRILEPGFSIDDNGLVLALKVLVGAMSSVYLQRETFQLTRVGDGGWGIYYKFAPSLAAPQKGQEIVQPIAGCRIDIKRAFIRIADRFFSVYLKQVRGTVADIDQDLGVGRDVLKALDQIE